MKTYTIRSSGIGGKRRNCGYAFIKCLTSPTNANQIKIDIINRYGSTQLKNRNKILFDELIKVIRKHYDLEDNNSNHKNRSSHKLRRILRRTKNGR